jgi:hypothetical protein
MTVSRSVVQVPFLVFTVSIQAIVGKRCSHRTGFCFTRQSSHRTTRDHLPYAQDVPLPCSQIAVDRSVIVYQIGHPTMLNVSTIIEDIVFVGQLGSHSKILLDK